MITELQYVELTNRLKELEAFRQKAIIVFYVVTVLGTFLTGLGWYGNTLINKMQKGIETVEIEESKILDKITSIQSSADDMENTVAQAINKIELASSTTILDFKNDVEQLTRSQKEYLSKISIEDLLRELGSGQHALRLSALEVVNKENQSVVKISPPSSSDDKTVIRVFDQTGKSRIKITDNAQYVAFNEFETKVLSIGSYNDSGKGYLRLYDNAQITAELGSNVSGGYFSANNAKQKQIVYLGASSDKSSGILTLLNIDGEKRAQMAASENSHISIFNNKNKYAFSAGATENNAGYLKLTHGDGMGDNAPQLKILTSDTGAQHFMYSGNGQQTIYLGTATNNYRGLLKLFDQYGNNPNDLTSEFPGPSHSH